MENIIANNNLIAEFMGGLFNKHSNKYGIGNAEYVTIGKLNNVVKAINHYDIIDLKYHTDWNWLMEVVEKIESLEDLERFEITTFNVSVQYYETKQKRFDYNLYFSTIELEAKVIPKIEAVYNACVEFIKWYNEQK
jgi:hypothetical protein